MEATKGVFCKTHPNLNVRICSCPNCQNKRKPTIQDRILAVLSDNLWHTQKEIAQKADLENEENHIDIGRDIRNMRREDGGSYPVDTKHVEGMIYEYRLLPESEAAAFWEKRNSRIAAMNALKDKVAELEAALSALKAENKYLSDYNQECEKEIERLRHGVAASVAVAA